MTRRTAILFLLLVLCFCLTLLSQQQPKEDKPFVIGVDVQLVELPVSVFDKNGLMISALAKENFKVFEDKAPQEITLFKHEDIPLSMGLIIDNSGSMRNKRERVHSAALTFVRESNMEDETFVIAFDDFAYLQQDFTGSIGDLVDALEDLDPRLGTAAYDAIYLGVDHVKQGKLNKKALLVISDGEDKDSKLTYEKVLNYVKASRNISIYTIGLLDEDEGSGGLFGIGRSPQKKAKAALTELAEVTGGRAYFPKSIDEVEMICKQIARELRNQYTLGYAPTNKAKDGTSRAVTVEVVNPPKGAGKITVNAPKGYVAPGGPTP
jgi:Ca-activated chloride channel family protein